MNIVLPVPKLADITLAGILKSLSDPTRLTIVAQLFAAEGEVSCAEFNELGKKSNLSQHYRNLRLSGLISTRREGRHSYLTLRTKELAIKFPQLLATIVSNAKY
ncbi:ArsR/SmtB family transcription factor [Loigolactobacillus binensis]|uniref:ArsR/SmtB family transcription factor n=1 Tax=Loigolactobacillus binensis TaxID=2559922 RepID=A0ABW3ECR8_9LACO|nr:helix-turn-helix domain-containing protein [Loigolactobacillus binensis]